MPPDTTDVATTIDALTTADIGGRGAIDAIAAAARAQQGPAPAMQAADRLVEAVAPGETVLVLTGFLIPPAMVPETDGPPGAVALARAIDRALDATAIIACDPAAVEICTATATAGGLRVLDRATAADTPQSVAVTPFPADRAEAQAHAETLVAAVDPAAVVAVEKVGPNTAGVYHNMAGYDVTDQTAKVDELYSRLPADVLTVAVGDAGNEVGMGGVRQTVEETVPYAAACQCPCGAGTASVIDADVLVPAAVSNWGAHAITAGLAHLTQTPVVHTPEVERRMLAQAAMAGAVDGIDGGTTGWCDGLAPAVHASLLRLLRAALGPAARIDDGGESDG